MNTQKTSRSRGLAAATLMALVLSLGACSSMSQRDRNTAIGAGLGSVTGSVLTDGSALGTLGGAAIGGVIGREIRTHK